jgi:uncharacterized membrane protein YhhN
MKFNFNNLFLIGYIVVAIIHLIGIATDQFMLSDGTKVLLLPLLIGHALKRIASNTQGFGVLLFALLFCWFGDILLIFTEKNELFFLLGLAAFLLGHIGYIIAFKKFSKNKVEGKKMSFVVYLAPLLFAVALLMLLFPELGDMMVPVIAYATVISIMCMAALGRWHKTNNGSFVFVLAGAVFFIISDALIAINKFYAPFELASFLIMITYIKAQYLILVGLIKHTTQTN